MRTLLAIVILAMLGWSGYWYLSASAREDTLRSWLDERRADGWVAEAADIEVAGFPNRLDATVTGLALADPASGWAWEAESFQILSLSYRPHHLIAAWPGEQVVATPYDTIRVTGENLRGSVVFEPSASLTLDRSTIELGGVRIVGEGGWEAEIGRAVLATRQTEGAQFSHDIAFDATDLVPPQALADLLGGSVLPEAIRSVRLDAAVTFDKAWDRQAVEEANPEIEGVELREFSADWGDLDLRGRGDLTVDERGYAVGELRIRARNWEEMLDAAERSGAMSPAVIGGVRAGLGLLAILSGNRESLTVPLEFEDGRARIGPVVVGTAPRLAPGRGG
jgi:hypothetical protein